MFGDTKTLVRLTCLFPFLICENISWTHKKSLYVSEGYEGSLSLQKGHLKVTKERKSTCEKPVSA